MSASDPASFRIFTLRDQRVVLDSDLAVVYGTSTSAFNQAVSRNLRRFPEDFSFVLTTEELEGLISQNVISKPACGGRTKPPRVFTEHGALMAASILNSDRAISLSVFVVRAFVRMREQIKANADVLKRLADIDEALLKHDHSLQILWQEIQPLLSPPPPQPAKPRIGFHGDSALPSPKPKTAPCANAKQGDTGYQWKTARPLPCLHPS
jgi:hypothetical protein